MGAGFCPTCGRPLGAAPGAPPGPLPPASGGLPYARPYQAYPFYPSVPFTPGPTGPTAQTAGVDRVALSYIFYGALVLLFSSGIGVVTLVAGSTVGLNTQVTAGGSLTSVRFGVLFWVVLAAEAAVEVTAIVLARIAFHRLSRVDERFRTPSTLALLLLVGIVLALAGAYPLLSGLNSLLTCTNAASRSMTNPSACFNNSFWVGIAAVAIGGLLALIGGIGVLIGLWRLGSRFNQSMFKVGAVLAIFPFLNLVGTILILVAASSAKDGVARMQGPTAPTF